eukprot:CAMPEP_0114588784 /NCGR_PEP_ID=MMETSP0125-20121206/11406_1 /TAXON_ID=485358 ORGANISM="Aristerostoma sp., Strain ATCC 50986" /NCGR_SAMPLE_ID=MMETSP0125 /ASSEMBLY_ACC=CAM_ASM_000245 /LENGTH=125 /DNA_ID=CAMNT_0001785365 /DNA_START=1045 /DNA_END=1422 /DNA_ORIENTATION=-
MGFIALSLGEKEEGEKKIDQGFEIAEAYYGEANPEIATFYFEYGLYLNSNRNPTKASKYFEKAVEIETNYSAAKLPLPSTDYGYNLCTHFKGHLKTSVGRLKKLSHLIIAASSSNNQKLIFLIHR